MAEVHLWESEVRDYELDIQGVVNNANYLHYLEHARAKLAASRGIDICQWHEEGFDLMVAHVDISFKKSLEAGNHFTVETTSEKVSKLRLLFHQQIIRKEDEALIAQAKTTVICFSTQEKKLVFPERLAEAFG